MRATAEVCEPRERQPRQLVAFSSRSMDVLWELVDEARRQLLEALNAVVDEDEKFQLVDACGHGGEGR